MKTKKQYDRLMKTDFSMSGQIESMKGSIKHLGRLNKLSSHIKSGTASKKDLENYERNMEQKGIMRSQPQLSGIHMPKPKMRLDVMTGKYKPDGIHMPTIDRNQQNHFKRPYNSKGRRNKSGGNFDKIEEGEQEPNKVRDRSKEQRDQYNAKLRQILMAKDQGAAFYHERTEHMMRVMERFEDGTKEDMKFYEGYPEPLRQTIENAI